MLATTNAISNAQMPVRPRYQNSIRIQLSIREPMAVRPKDTKLIASEIIITTFNNLLISFIAILLLMRLLIDTVSVYDPQPEEMLI